MSIICKKLYPTYYDNIKTFLMYIRWFYSYTICEDGKPCPTTQKTAMKSLQSMCNIMI